MTFQSIITAYHQIDTTQRLVDWTAQRDRWIAEQKSPHTRRSYADAWDAFATYAPIAPWEVTSDHARAWRDTLLAMGKAPSTVAQRLAVLSSFYKFVIEYRPIMLDGREQSFFTDTAGFTRSNPFAVARPNVRKWEKGNPLPPQLVARILGHINTGTLTGARNHALLLTYLGTGYRNTEVRTMRWGDIRPHPTALGQWTYAWTGKRDKAQTDPLPIPVVQAIRAYLAAAARLHTIQPKDFIWQPLRSAGVANLAHVNPAQLNPARCISQKQAVRILRTCISAVGGDAAAYRIHDLRHTFCVEHYREFGDLVALRQQSHHATLSTLETYLRPKTADPIDTYSDRLFTRLGIG